MMGFRLLSLLIEKGLISQEEAAKVMVSTAGDLRSGTEDDAPSMKLRGELYAKAFEHLAGWLLGHSPELPKNDP